MRVVVDVERCRGAGLCALTAPDVFDQDEEDGTVLVLDPQPPPDHQQAVVAAARLCPNSVISLEDT
jgi:ferredoxin